MSVLNDVVICGSSGYVGQHLRRALDASGVTVRTIGRGGTSDGVWSDEQSVIDVLDGADLVVNLAGRSVSCRYNKRNADEIFSSRVETTAQLGRALVRTPQPPSLWVNASTGTIYRNARDRPMDEKSGELGKGFSVAVARAWEQELFDAPTPIRKVALRLSIVLGAGGGAINPLINLARMGFGGRMGDGQQMFSWVHIDDVVRSIIHIVEHQDIAGPVNIATPFPVTNDAMMREVRATLGRQHGLPTPGWMLEFGARIIRTEAELVLKSRWVEPGVLAATGFQFKFPTLESALSQIAHETPRGLLPVALG
ncbi:TIGR01777 family oxidoreductase [Rhodococcus sp. IEGM 1379]|uniref:TIGR01777 family oxidoreductase n=1 Tax=Rhodococcus sp. IEGM 1379 TaxID=3047086 RepID=UPI0024B6F37C|nr:TIGR01777 family oxidoreductase [Rhodococcus sp. IEGM 1379]MDI9913834.1 TIGR01777 family oxidoreductase [Rhodococcus sp. IEGM 1379]